MKNGIFRTSGKISDWNNKDLSIPQQIRPAFEIQPLPNKIKIMDAEDTLKGSVMKTTQDDKAWTWVQWFE